MGLKENRLRKVIEDENIPYHIRNYKEHFGGGDLEVQIDWDEWSSDHDGLLNLNGYVLQQFTDSLNKVGSDDAAKQALREGLEKVHVVRVENASDASVALADKVLTLRVAPVHAWDGVVHSSDIATCLLDNL